MAKSIFRQADCALILSRLGRISATSKPLWGSMQPENMLQHCRIISDSLLYGKPSPEKPSFKQRFFKTLILHRIAKLPHGRTQPARIALLIEQEGAPVFKQEKDSLIASIKAFAKHTDEISAVHPVFGNMNRKEWGQFAWVHLDHHLRQFGV